VKVLHVITGLGQGGAEAVLYRLVAASAPATEHVVVSLTSDLHHARRLQALGTEVHALGIGGGIASAGGLLRLKRIIADAAPDVVQTWMYHADLVGGLMARWAGTRAIVWGVRHSRLDSDKSSMSARMAAKACAWLSQRLPAAIACCSEKAVRVHLGMGYRADKFTVIQNGYDLERLVPDPEARSGLRNEWTIAPGAILLGMVARWDPYKDHGNLLRALALLGERGRDFKCALVGRGMVHENRALSDVIDRLGLSDRMILAGPRDDIPAVMNALDLHVLSSAGEAFPNTVAEAMACGTPCVATDVGDAALIVGDTGWVVPALDAGALAQGIEDALAALSAKGRAELGQRCRTRIEENFSLGKMVDAYRALWKKVAVAEAGNH